MGTEIETIKNGQNIIAIILYNDYLAEGIKFFTPNEFSQQLAFISRDSGEIIQAHTHNIAKREVSYTQEVLVIKKGKIRVNFYDDQRKYLDFRVLGQGDIILLAGGGHGFKILEKIEMVEIKQGPYLGEGDKTRFKGIEE